MGKDNVHVKFGNSVGEMRNASARFEQVADTSVPAIEMVDLCKSFGKFQAVDHLSLTVPRGEIFGLLGPNGSGKTTTINMVSGLSVPTCGKVRVMGYEIVDAIDALEGVKQVKQDGTYLTITTQGITNVVPQIINIISQEGEIRNISVREPNLDEVFLRLTGTALRD